jgi:ABC-type multidrug transport system ATPase subunit
MKESGKTVFLASQELADIESICDEAAIICKGEIIFRKTFDKTIPGNGQSLEEVFLNLIS